MHFFYKSFEFFVLSLLALFLALARYLVSVTLKKFTKIKLLSLLFGFSWFGKDVSLLLLFELSSSLANTVGDIVTTLLNLFDIGIIEFAIFLLDCSLKLLFCSFVFFQFFLDVLLLFVLSVLLPKGNFKKRGM